MRISRPLSSVFLLLLPLAAFAADFTVTLTDPRSQPVAGARVALYRAGSAQAVAVQSSSSEGQSLFSGLAPGEYRVEVLAPGFAPASAHANIPQQPELSLRLAIAVPAQTVVVTATRSPLPADESGAAVSLLDRPALDDMQPIAADDALRFLSGAVVNTAGRHGGLGSLFVRGGESRYNKVIVDGVPVNEPGGTFDFGVLPLTGVERLELLRGPASTLYGSDAMTSVVQLWSASGHTPVPELRFGADGGTFSTARGYASLAGARGRFDYNFFAEQDASQGQGVNDDYSSSSQGMNLGVRLAGWAAFRLRARHSNSRTGVQGTWDFNGRPLLSPDQDAFARQNNFLASAEFTVSAPERWQHRFSAYEYSHRGLNQDAVPDRGCNFFGLTALDFLDCPFSSPFSVNRAGFEYQADYAPRSWARTTFGYEFEDENGFFDSQFATLDFEGNPAIDISHTHGLRRNHALYAEQALVGARVSFLAGVRYVHNESFGDKAVPRAALTLLALRGGDFFSGTRLRFAYSEGIKEPRFEESFGITGTFPTNPNPNLKPEQNRSLEAGVQQSLAGGRASLVATYFNNAFRNQIAFQTDPVTFIGQYFNINRSLAHGAEVEFHGRLRSALALDAAYVYTSSQVLLAPAAFDPVFAAGAPLLRRPRHSGSLLLTYFGKRWGGDLGASFVGRRADSDFLGLGIDHAAGYARLDLGGWLAINRYMTAYVNLQNALNKRYEEVVGYPALRASFRAGMRFRMGGE